MPLAGCCCCCCWPLSATSCAASGGQAWPLSGPQVQVREKAVRLYSAEPAQTAGSGPAKVGDKPLAGCCCCCCCC